MKNKNISIRVISGNTFPVGGQWYTNATNFWKWRAIFYSRGLDFVPDRGGFSDNGFSEERKAFLNDILESKEFSDWLSYQYPNSDEIFCATLGDLEFRATNNRSYGYTYLWAYIDTKEDLTPF